MKAHMRVALPLLSELRPVSRLDFVMLDRAGQPVRSGTLPAAELSTLAGGRRVQAILHPADAIVCTVSVPPIAPARLTDAVRGRIEPMLLGDPNDVVVAHGPRSDSGEVTVAWTTRSALEGAWQQLNAAGLRVQAFVPHALVIPEDDASPQTPLTLPVSARWLGVLPDWALTVNALRSPRGLGQWRRPLAWALAALGLWVAGLNVYAWQLSTQVRHLRVAMREAVARAFPDLPVIIDPVRQAENQRDGLRLAQGAAAGDEFIPLALSGARVLDFAQGHVRSLQYDEGVLTLVLGEGYLPPADEEALAQAASVQQLLLEHDASLAHTWHIRRSTGTGDKAGASS